MNSASVQSIDLGAPLQVNSFGFNIPCRQFLISAQVTKDRRMPLVDEFVLRALRIAESISIPQLARFFGFDDRDLAIVLSDLSARSMVNITKDQVELHPSAKELFRVAGNNPPAISNVESIHAHVWFDLISNNMVASRGLHNVKHLISLKQSNPKAAVDVAFAREAFDSNFRDYLKNYRRIRNPDQWSLYSILDVQPGRYSYAQIAGRVDLTTGAHPKLETTLQTESGEHPTKLKDLTVAMFAELEKLTVPETSATSKNEYYKLIHSTSLNAATDSNGLTNLAEWLRLEATQAEVDCQPFIGYPYVERNRKQLTAMLSRLDLSSEDVQDELTLIWLRPGGTTWGVTEDIGNTLSEVRTAMRKLSGGARVTSSLFVPSSVTPKHAKSFARVFDRGYQNRAGRFAPAIEVLGIPGVFATVSVLVALADGVQVPVGRMVTRREQVGQIFERFKVDHTIAASTLLWPSENVKR